MKAELLLSFKFLPEIIFKSICFQTFLTSTAKSSTVRLRTKWLWISIPLQSHTPAIITNLEKELGDVPRINPHFVLTINFNARSRNGSSNDTAKTEGAQLDYFTSHNRINIYFKKFC